MWRTTLVPGIVAAAIAAGTLGSCASGSGEGAGKGQDAPPPAPSTDVRGGGGEAGRAGRGGEEARPADGGGREAPPAGGGGDQAVRFALATNNSCLQARQRAGALKPPRTPAQLAGYARQALPRAGLTLAALQQANPPAESLRAVRALQGEYARLLRLYEQAAVGKGPGAKTLRRTVEAAEQTVARSAARAGVGGCAPGPVN